MPWTPNDARTQTHKATTRKPKKPWAKRQRMLERTGDEGRAIREANAVVARQAEASYYPSSSPAVTPATLPLVMSFPAPGFDPLIELSASLHFPLEALITIPWPI